MKSSLTVIAIVLALSLVSIADVPLAFAVVSSCDFTPKAGGPGTVLHVSCAEVYQPAVVNLVVVRATGGWGGLITSYEVIGARIGTIQPNPQGGVESSGTVVIPSGLSNGTRITERHLGILFTDESGQPLSEIPVKAFEFTPASLPVAGHAGDSLWLLSGLVSTMLVIGGLLLRRDLAD